MQKLSQVLAGLIILLALCSAATPAQAQTTTPASGTGFTAATNPECPNVSPVDKWRFANKTTQRPDGSVILCLQIVAGDEAVDLNDTIVVNLPQGAQVVQNSFEQGRVAVAGSTISWGRFSLNARQSSSLLLNITNVDVAKIRNTTLTISGRFTATGQAFKGQIPSLAGLTEVEVLSNGQFDISMPGTGLGGSNPAQEGNWWLWLALPLGLAGASLLLLAKLRRAR